MYTYIGGRRRQTAFILALNEVSDKVNGLFKDILPETTVEFVLRDSKRDSGSATIETVHMVSNSNNGKGIVGLLGPASSGPSESKLTVQTLTNLTVIQYRHLLL